MEPLPLPSHIHYELLLQLLERQTMSVVNRRSPQQEQIQELIVTLRKALSQQKHLEESCERAKIPIDYRWSLNQTQQKPGESPAEDRSITAKVPIATDLSIAPDLPLAADLPIAGIQPLP